MASPSHTLIIAATWEDMPHKKAKHSVRQADRKSKGNNLAPTSNDGVLRDMPKGALRILNAGKVQEEYNRRKREQQQQQQQKREGGSATDGKKRGNKRQQGGGAKGQAATPLKIRAGERMNDFSQRVEREMAHEVHATFKATTSTSSKKKRKKAGGATEEAENEQRTASQTKAAKRAEQEPDRKTLRAERARLQGTGNDDDDDDEGENRDWQKATQRRRLNDVVQAPPTLTKAPRGQSAEALKRKAELTRLMHGDAAADAQTVKMSKARLPDGVLHNGSLIGMRRQAELEQERDKAVKAYRQAKEERIREQEERKAAEKQ